MKTKKKDYEIFVLYILMILLEVFFFRSLFSSGALIGDNGDGRLNNLIMEHWYHVFQGKEAVDTLSQFYPFGNSLSYTDMLLGEGFLYSIMRELGVNLFVACNLTLIIIHCLGTFFTFILLTNEFNLKAGYAFVGVITFSFANAYTVKTSHTQLFALSFLPIILYVLVKCIKYALQERHGISRLLLFLFTGLYVLLAYSGWYVFFFSAVFVCIFSVLLFVIMYINNKQFIMKCIAWTRKRVWWLISALICFVLLLIPLLKMYIPTSKMSGGRKYGDVLYFSPQIRDIINVGSKNLIMGKFLFYFDEVWNRPNKGEGELTVGFSIFTLVLLLSLSLYYKKKMNRYSNSKRNEPRHLIIRALMHSIFVSLLLTIDWGGWSVWYIVWRFVPGGGSLRAVSRWYFFLIFPIGILISILLNETIDFKDRTYMGFVVLVSSLTLCFNINVTNISLWNANDMKAYLDNVTIPDERVKVMVLYKPGGSEPDHVNQLNAWMIADYFGIKTLNGYSGNFPIGFLEYMCDGYNEEYLDNCKTWCNINDVTEDVFVYNEVDRTWTVLNK